MPDSRAADIWPSAVQSDVTNVDVAISRTDRQNGHDQQIESLHLDLIAAAREFIYIENQYLTSELIVAALGARLQQIDGPEIVIVLPLNNFGWLEAHTIEILRVRAIQRLRGMDRFHRLRIMCPVVPDMHGRSVGVHSKLLIVDDRLMRIGSSNLTNRSMRVDTECDLTIEAENATQRTAIAAWRNRLLAEHLGMAEKQVRDFLSSERSLLRLVDSRHDQARRLREIPDKHTTEGMMFGAELADPHRPLTSDVVFEALATSVKQQPVRRLLPLALVFGGAAALLTLIAVRRR
jgi:phosphatidylserine/phosphatidylglycerophosphate/cardiolipin synthase-like enzyme